MSNYPDQIDTDADLPRFEDNITEIGADALNAIRAAVFAIEQTLGTDVQGSEADLKTRLEAIINPDGTFKSAALVAAGLIALPITNSMVGASAGIVESKLDLDFTTQVLQNEISSNDIDITALQVAVNDILNRIAEHFDGIAFKHDGYAINLDSDFPSTAPPGIAPLTAITVTDAIVQLKDRFMEHIGITKTNAHTASNINVALGNFTSIDPDNVQEALEQLDQLGERQLEIHLDDAHANGISHWANTLDGYNSFLQKAPATLGSSVTALILPSLRKVIEFTDLTLSAFGIQQGDVVVISGSSGLDGAYSIDDVGPRLAIGSRSALSASQVEIVGIFATDGYVSARIYGESSVNTLKGNLAPTIYQIDTRVDSVQLSRPNAARVVSLGANPRFLTSSSQFTVEAGIADSISRTITVSSLNLDRNQAVVSEITLDSVIERINYVFQNKNDGYAFPAAAYRVGDEVMISHNWCESIHNYIKIPASGGVGNTLFLLGLDGYGADILDDLVRPTNTSNFYVSGRKFTDFRTLLETTANIVFQTFTFPGGENPLELGVRVGHLLHLFDHTNSSECGTYYITSVNNSSVSIHKVSGITTDTNVSVKIISDAAPLDEIANNSKEMVLEIFVDAAANTDYNIRLSKTTGINNVSVIDVSDNFLPTELTLTASSVSGGNQFDLGIDAIPVILPTGFEGSTIVKYGSNIETLTLRIESPIVANSDDVAVFDHINEEEVLEICSVNFDGLLTLSSIKDKRLFGSTGLDELREDVVQAHVEAPLIDLRSNGIVYGFDIEETNFQDISSFGSSVYGLVIRGGVCYVSGVRLDVPTTNVMIPTTAGTYLVYINNLGTFNVIDESTFSISESLDGYNGELALIAKVVNSGSLTNPLASEDLRFFINDLDDKLDLILDLTNRRIGHFATVEAALNYINNYPFDERFILKVVSYTTDDIVIPPSFANITIQIDGQIGNLIIDSDCRILSAGLSTRLVPHIDGYIFISSTATNVYLDELNVDGATLVAQPASGHIRIKNSKFNDTITNTGNATATLEIDSCGFSAGSGVISGDSRLKVSNCVFDSGSVSTSSGSSIFIADCIFQSGDTFGELQGDFIALDHNLYSTGTDVGLVVDGNTTISNCIFDNITLNNFDLITSDIDSIYNVDIDNCVFTNISLSGTAQIIDGYGTTIYDVSGNVFDVITFTSDTAFTANSFHNNVLTNATNSSLIGISGGGSFTNNVGFHTVQIDVSFSSEPVVISNNNFAQSSLGENVLASSTNAIISNNIFNNIAASTSGIVLTSTSEFIQITGNYFNGAAPAAIAINMADALGDITVSDNYFRTDTIFSYSSAINKVLITDNIFNSSNITTSTIQVGNDFKFSNNISLRSNFTLTGINPSRIQITGNEFSTGRSMTFSVPMTEASISNNRATNLFFNSGGLTNSEVCNNIIGLNATGTYPLVHTTFADNVFISIGNSVGNVFSNFRWDRSYFVNNIITSAVAMIFSLNTANTLLISGNQWSGNNIAVSGSSNVTKLNFNNNYNMSLTVTNAIDCNIANNNGNLTITSMTRTKVCGNFGDGTLTASTNIIDSVISDNVCSTISIAPGTTSTRNIISNNHASTQIGIMTTAAGTELTDSVIRGNIAGTTMIIGIGTGTHSLVNTIIDSNIVGTDFNVGGNGSFTDIVISNNQSNTLDIECDGTLNLKVINNTVALDATLDANGSSCTSVQISHNTIGDGLEMSNAIYDNLILDGNYIVGILNLPANAGFSTGAGQSKIYFNFAETWASSGTLDTTSTTGIFPWGNTGSGTDGSVTFGGTTATNTVTANNLSGGIDT